MEIFLDRRLYFTGATVGGCHLKDGDAILSKYINYAILWSWLSLAIRSSAQLIIMPFALVRLSPEELGYWYLFGGIGAFLLKIEFGMTPCISREFAFQLAKEADDRQPKGTASFIYSVEKIYRQLALAVIIVVFLVAAYLFFYGSSALDPAQLLATWCLFGISAAVSVWGNTWIGLLYGMDKVALVNRNLTWSGAINVVITLLCLYQGLGLMSLSLGMLGGVVVGRAACWLAFRQNNCWKEAGVSDVRYWLTHIWPAVWRTGFIDIGASLIYFSNILLASTFLSMSVAATYGLTFQILQLGMFACGVPLAVSIPRLNRLFAQRRIDEAWKTFLPKHLFGLLLYVSFIVFIGSIGQDALNFIGSRTPLLDGWLFILLGVIMVLEFNHGYFASLLMASGRIPFVIAALGSGVAIAVIGWFMVQAYGLIGLILSVGLVQLAFNNWWVPWKTIKELRIARSAQIDVSEQKKFI
jgi:O-antigen/teichoic acid export membrane protein